jgi:hypothetical protein
LIIADGTAIGHDGKPTDNVTRPHAGFQEPPQMLERFRKCPGLQRSRLIERAWLLLEERQKFATELRETIFR